MNVKFNGIRSNRLPSQRLCCGRGARSSGTFQRSKTLVLPSGRNETFEFGMTYELSEADATYALGLTQEYNGNKWHFFSEV